MKRISCGTFIFVESQRKFLLGHATGMGNKYDLPKGGIEEGETEMEAAIRECDEEFGLLLDGKRMSRIGKYRFNAKKDLVLFHTSIKNVDLNLLHCRAMVVLPYKTFPEMDGYKLFSYSELKANIGMTLDACLENNGLYEYLFSKYPNWTI